MVSLENEATKDLWAREQSRMLGVTFSVFFLSICDLSECMEVLFRPVIF